jgi:uncharacterized damage-inducible protein DinB
VSYDLTPDPQMTPLVGMLHATVIDSFQRLRRVLTGVTQAELDFHGPDGTCNSISQMIRHLILIDLRWAYRFRSEPLPANALDRFGPFRDPSGRLPLAAGRPTEDLIAEYEWVLEQLRLSLVSLTDTDLTRRVMVDGGVEATFRWGIWHMADHSRFHQGHINWLIAWVRSQS